MPQVFLTGYTAIMARLLIYLRYPHKEVLTISVDVYMSLVRIILLCAYSSTYFKVLLCFSGTYSDILFLYFQQKLWYIMVFIIYQYMKFLCKSRDI